MKAGTGRRVARGRHSPSAELNERRWEPPDGLPVYRILTGPDDAAFCRRVSEAIALGYVLHGSPALAFDGERVIAAQALIWPP